MIDSDAEEPADAAADAEDGDPPGAGEAETGPDVGGGRVLRVRDRWVPIVVGVVLLAVVLATGAVLVRSGDDASGDGSTAPTAAPGSPTTSTPAAWQTQFLACVRQRESGDDYTEVGPGGQAFGAYQITQGSWNNTVQHYGWTQLSGVRPDQATPADQDMVAMGLLQWQGPAPWGGSCSS